MYFRYWNPSALLEDHVCSAWGFCVKAIGASIEGQDNWKKSRPWASSGEKRKGFLHVFNIWVLGVIFVLVLIGVWSQLYESSEGWAGPPIAEWCQKVVRQYSSKIIVTLAWVTLSKPILKSALNFVAVKKPAGKNSRECWTNTSHVSPCFWEELLVNTKPLLCSC